MRRLRSAVLLFAAALVVVPSDLHAQKKQRGDRDHITQDDLADAPGLNTAFDVIRTLRPQWLNPPMMRTPTAVMTGGGGGATTVAVYIDDIRQTTEDLNNVKTATIVGIRYLDQNRAIQMRGPGHESGVIEVTTVYKKK